MVSDIALIFHMYIPWGKNLFFRTKVKFICQGQGQISRSQFSKKKKKKKKKPLRVHSCFTNTSCFNLKVTQLLVCETKSIITCENGGV